MKDEISTYISQGEVVDIDFVYVPKEFYTKPRNGLPSYWPKDSNTVLLDKDYKVIVTKIGSNMTEGIPESFGAKRMIIYHMCKLTRFTGYKPQAEPKVMREDEFLKYFRLYKEGDALIR